MLLVRLAGDAGDMLMLAVLFMLALVLMMLVGDVVDEIDIDW